MSCEYVRQLLLDLDLDDQGRRAAAVALEHLAECADCQKALADFDTLRGAVATTDPEGEPLDGWTMVRPTIHRPSWRSGSWFPTLAIAALIAVLVAAFEIGRLGNRGNDPSIVAVSGHLPLLNADDWHLAPTDINNQIRAFHQVSQVFDGRASWMLMSDHASDVGVTDRDVDVAGKVLLLHLTLADASKEISVADLMVIPGQTADLNIPLGAERVVHYRVGTSTDDATHLSLTLELRSPAGAEPLAALSTNLRMEPGQKVSAGELVSNSDTYKLKVGFAEASLSSEGRQ